MVGCAGMYLCICLLSAFGEGNPVVIERYIFGLRVKMHDQCSRMMLGPICVSLVICKERANKCYRFRVPLRHTPTLTQLPEKGLHNYTQFSLVLKYPATPSKLLIYMAPIGTGCVSQVLSDGYRVNMCALPRICHSRRTSKSS